MLRKVKLYGELANFVGYKELDAVINSTADAIRFLVTNFEGLEAHMNQRYYKILVDNYEIGKEDIHNPIGQSDISIVPVIAGAGGGGKALLGIALIGVAFMLPVAVPLAPLKFGGLGGFVGANAALANLGLGLTLMGVSEMLFPLPKPQEFSNEEDPRIRSEDVAQNQEPQKLPQEHLIL